MAKLDGKAAVVTGAASGMGKAIAALYAKEGAKVVASDLNLEGVQQTVAEIEAAGGTALAVQANVASEEDVQHLMDTAVKEYGTLDILVNNAGIMNKYGAGGGSDRRPVGKGVCCQHNRADAYDPQITPDLY